MVLTWESAVPSAVKTFILWHIPLYILIFCVLLLVLVKLLGNPLKALPIAVIGTAASGAFLAMESNFRLGSPAIAVGDIIVVLGIAVVVGIIYFTLKVTAKV